MAAKNAEAHAFSHTELKINFTCPCGHWFPPKEGDFTAREYVQCTQCGRKHYPVVKIVTERG